MTVRILFWFFLNLFVVVFPLTALEDQDCPLRIVSTVPSQTELLFALGFGPQMVGATDYCNYPASAAFLERCGAIELNLEKLVSLKPTHVVDLQSMHRRYQGALERLQIKYLDYPLRSVKDVPGVAASLATDLGRPEAGIAFVAGWSKEMGL